MYPTESTYEDYLAHYGTKGMKWGLRKGGLASRARQVGVEKKTKRIEQRERVLSGKSSIRDKVAAGSTLSLAKVLKNKGVKNAIAKDLTRDMAARSRLESGQATTRDKLEVAMNISILDLAVKRGS